MYHTLKKLLPLSPGVSGREATVRGVIEELMRPLVDEISVDAMGNLICRKRGSAKQRVHYGVRQHVRVRVTKQSFIVRD